MRLFVETRHGASLQLYYRSSYPKRKPHSFMGVGLSIELFFPSATLSSKAKLNHKH